MVLVLLWTKAIAGVLLRSRTNERLATSPKTPAPDEKRASAD